MKTVRAGNAIAAGLVAVAVGTAGFCLVMCGKSWSDSNHAAHRAPVTDSSRSVDGVAVDEVTSDVFRLWAFENTNKYVSPAHVDCVPRSGDKYTCVVDFELSDNIPVVSPRFPSGHDTRNSRPSDVIAECDVVFEGTKTVDNVSGVKCDTSVGWAFVQPRNERDGLFSAPSKNGSDDNHTPSHGKNRAPRGGYTHAR